MVLAFDGVFNSRPWPSRFRNRAQALGSYDRPSRACNLVLREMSRCDVRSARERERLYSYSASRYSYSIDCSETVSVCWINRVNIDTIRFKLVLPIRFDSASIASNEISISWIAAHSNAEPLAISKKRFLSFRLCLPFPSAMFNGIDCAARSHWSRA